MAPGATVCHRAPISDTPMNPQTIYWSNSTIQSYMVQSYVFRNAFLTFLKCLETLHFILFLFLFRTI